MAIFRIILSRNRVVEAPPMEDDGEDTPDEPIEE